MDAGDWWTPPWGRIASELADKAFGLRAPQTKTGQPPDLGIHLRPHLVLFNFALAVRACVNNLDGVFVAPAKAGAQMTPPEQSFLVEHVAKIIVQDDSAEVLI